MHRYVPKPWLAIWLLLVLTAGIAFSFARQKGSNLVPGESLFTVGLGLIVVAGIIGSARTGQWFSWDGPVVPSRAEWVIGLTGAALFLAPLLHVLFLFFGSALFGHV